MSCHCEVNGPLTVIDSPSANLEDPFLAIHIHVLQTASVGQLSCVTPLAALRLKLEALQSLSPITV